MIRIALVGDIGSGKTYISKQFNFPVFSADKEVANLYKTSRKCFVRLHNMVPKFIFTYPIQKSEILKAILNNKSNLKKIVKITHPEINNRMKIFLNKNKNKKVVILDIPLFLEKKLNKKNDNIIYIQAKQKNIKKKLNLRKNYNKEILKKLKDLQYSLKRKRTKSNYVIKNTFNKKSARKAVKNVLNKILSWKKSY